MDFALKFSLNSFYFVGKSKQKKIRSDSSLAFEQHIDRAMKFLLSLGVVFMTWTIVNSFDCYECENCQSPFNSQTNVATCSVGVTQCMKITAKLGTVYNYILKQCGPCSNETFAFGVTYLRVDCCSGSTCNSTSSLTVSFFTLSLLILFLIAFLGK